MAISTGLRSQSQGSRLLPPYVHMLHGGLKGDGGGSGENVGLAATRVREPVSRAATLAEANRRERIN